MKRLFLGLCSLLFLFSCKGRTPDVPQKASDDHSLLWRISGKGLTKPSYLFGTIHMICQDDYVWTDAMEKSYAASEQVCMEMDMDDPSLMMQVTMGMMDMSGKQLKDYFTPEQYTQIEQYAKDSLGMSLDIFQMMRPIALIPMLSSQNTGCDSPVSYELKLTKEAQNDHKEITGLETAQEQIEVLNSMPTDSLVAEIVKLVQGNDSGSDDEKKSYNRMLSAYKTQDLPALYQAMKEGGEMSGEWNAFLDDRNKKWISRMEAKMKQHSIFFAVGAGHLYGDAGVIRLLRKAGYQVEAVK